MWCLVVNQFCTGGCEDRTRAREAEESPLLEPVARERLVKIWQARRCLAALYLRVVPIGVYKWSLNRVTNPNPVYSNTYYVTVYFMQPPGLGRSLAKISARTQTILRFTLYSLMRLCNIRGICWVDHDRVLLDPFQFVIHYQSTSRCCIVSILKPSLSILWNETNLLQ
jgi:hypothetical protein